MGSEKKIVKPAWKENFAYNVIFNIIKPLSPAIIHLASPLNKLVLEETFDFLLKSGEIHHRFFKPTAKKMEPQGYAGKMESTLINMLCDTFNFSLDDLQRLPPEVFKGIIVFNALWRTYDEVVDVKLNSTDRITEETLDNTPIYHKHLGRNIVGSEGLAALSECINVIIPGEDEAPRKKRENIMELIYSLRRRWVETANNKKYQEGDILSYEKALDSKRGLTGFLGEISAKLFVSLLNIEENMQNTAGIKLIEQADIVMQFGDDLIDWKKDWLEHIKEKEKGGNVRPIENLFLATLEENPKEKEALKKHLKDRRKTIKLVKKYAPETYILFTKRFEEQVDLLPDHPHRSNLKRFMIFSLKSILPVLPESGIIIEWGKW